MFPFPFDKFSITTNKSQQEVISDLMSNVDKGMSYYKRELVDESSFRGSCYENIFLITSQFDQFHIGKNRINSMLDDPVIWNPSMKVIIESTDDKTEVKVTSRPSNFLLVFASIFIVLSVFLEIYFLNSQMTDQWYIPLCIILFVIVWLCAFFWIFEFRAKKLLKNIII